jgi:excinuclease ABC subunit C
VPVGIDPETGRPRRFAYPPNLVIVDGGAPQVAAAQQALDALGVDDVALCGLAKRLEEVWLPNDPHPVVMARTSEGLYLLQRLRDEAHRFAIAHHRSRRSKSMTASALDGIAGLGETRRKALLKQFGSLKRLAAASVDDIIEVPGVGRQTAEAVVAALAAGDRTGGLAVNTATGEILDDSTDVQRSTAPVDNPTSTPTSSTPTSHQPTSDHEGTQ